MFEVSGDIYAGHWGYAASNRCLSSCGFTCNADTNAAINVAAGHAGGTTPRKRASVREPQLATP